MTGLSQLATTSLMMCMLSASNLCRWVSRSVVRVEVFSGCDSALEAFDLAIVFDFGVLVFGVFVD